MTALLIVAAVLAPRRLEAGRVPCPDVIKEVDRVIGRRGSYRPDPLRIARRLGVDPEWVVRCARLYGRRLSKEPARLIDAERDQLDERWEADEPIEIGREEQEAEEGRGAFLREERRQREPRATPTLNPEREAIEGFQ
jgi:hypothetical protein